MGQRVAECGDTDQKGGAYETDMSGMYPASEAGVPFTEEERMTHKTETTRAQHTPGPWKVGLRSEADGTIPVWTGREGPKAVGIADVVPHSFYRDAQLSNARLIAAAPTMLERGTALLEELDALLDYHEDANLQARADAFRAVLAAAEGRDA